MKIPNVTIKNFHKKCAFFNSINWKATSQNLTMDKTIIVTTAVLAMFNALITTAEKTVKATNII